MNLLHINASLTVLNIYVLENWNDGEKNAESH